MGMLIFDRTTEMKQVNISSIYLLQKGAKKLDSLQRNRSKT